MVNETLNKLSTTKTLTQTTFLPAKIDQTVMMSKKMRTRMKVSTTQMMTMMTQMSQKSQRSLKLRCNRNECSTFQISLSVKREAILIPDNRCIKKTNTMTLTQNFEKPLNKWASTKKEFEHFNSKCTSNKLPKKQDQKVIFKMEKTKMLTKAKNWLKCLTTLKEDQLEKCRFRTRKKTLVKMMKELKSSKFLEVAKTQRMKNKMKNMEWVKTRMEIKT